MAVLFKTSAAAGDRTLTPSGSQINENPPLRESRLLSVVIGNGDYHPKKKVQRFKALFPRSAYVGLPIPAALFCVALGVPIIL